jgi:uncharacterized protein involved in exopolysaccharide biosynthesis
VPPQLPATLLELVLLIGRRWRLISAATLAGGAIGLGIAVATPPLYEASAVVRIGTVPVRVGREGADARLLEAPAQAAERVKLPSFIAETKIPGEPRDLARNVVVRVVRETDLLEVNYRSTSGDDAQRGLQAIVTTLVRRHDELLQPVRTALTEQLRNVQQLRAETTERRGEILQSLRGAPLPSVRGELPFVQMAFAGQDTDLLRWEATLRSALAPPLTAQTALLETINVAHKPVTPARVLIVLAGALAGLLFSAAAVLARYVRDRKAHGRAVG